MPLLTDSLRGSPVWCPFDFTQLNQLPFNSIQLPLGAIYTSMVPSCLLPNRCVSLVVPEPPHLEGTRSSSSRGLPPQLYSSLPLSTRGTIPLPVGLPSGVEMCPRGITVGTFVEMILDYHNGTPFSRVSSWGQSPWGDLSCPQSDAWVI